MPLLRVWAGHSEHRLAMLQGQRDQQDRQQFWLAQLDTGRQVLPFAVAGSCPVGQHFGAGRSRPEPAGAGRSRPESATTGIRR